MMSLHRPGWWRPAVIVACTLGLLTGCTPPSGNLQPGSAMTIPPIEPLPLTSDRLRVVATTSILGDVVGQIGGDAIALTTLIGPGQDPHSYQATAQDMVAIEEAHIVFVVGLGLEEALLGTIESTATGPIAPVSAGIEPISPAGEEHDQEEGDHAHVAYDPHVWMDPNNVIIWTQNIRDVLSAADPANAAVYAANADAYITELEALDAAIREQLAQIPEANRKLVTDHFAFSYFAEEYGLQIVGAVIPGATTTAEPSAGDMADLVTLIQEEHVPAIFVGTSASERLQQLAELIAEEAGRDVQVLLLYSGSLDVPGQPGDTYIGMMRYDVDTIVQGLGSEE
jgi:ABC-type Zn uptake system ZnuABC Zn-binding protein ZnuA